MVFCVGGWRAPHAVTTTAGSSCLQSRGVIGIILGGKRASRPSMSTINRQGCWIPFLIHQSTTSLLATTFMLRTDRWGISYDGQYFEKYRVLISTKYNKYNYIDAQVFVLLPDMRIPVWDASSGNLVRLYSIPAVPNSISGIVPTPGLAPSKGLQIFIQTNKTDQVKYHEILKLF